MSKIRKTGRVSIIDDRIVKKKDKDNSKLFEYLKSRDFHNYLGYSERNADESVYPYIEDLSIDKYQKGEDLVKTLALLHNKTSYSKEINSSKYKEIRDNIISHVNYLDAYYYEMLDRTELIEYPSPSEIIFLRNYSKLLSLFDFIKQETNNWYDSVKTKNKQRVALNHGNIKLEHLIKNEQDYLISWDQARFDSPILDITNFYHEEFEQLDFDAILKNYLERCSLSDDEKKLLFINLAIPEAVKKKKDEMTNVNNMRRLFDYIYKTEILIGPYYSKKQEEK